MNTTIVSVSQNELSQRRRKLRQRRQVRVIQAGWRVLAMIALAGGVTWAVTLPNWVLRNPEQITVEGNHLISQPMVRSLLPIRYPQSLLTVEPQTIAQELKAKAPIADVVVSRRLFPPGLTVRLSERLPVAIAVPTGTGRKQTAASANPQASAESGLIDENGIWISSESLTSLDPGFNLPKLKVIGDPEQYKFQWSGVYQAIRQSPVTITEIDWQDPANLILKTELGIVHLGPYGAQFAAQLSTLDRMRKLRSYPSFNQIGYIDLRNPEAPSIQMGKSKDLLKTTAP